MSVVLGEGEGGSGTSGAKAGEVEAGEEGAEGEEGGGLGPDLWLLMSRKLASGGRSRTPERVEPSMAFWSWRREGGDEEKEEEIKKKKKGDVKRRNSDRGGER